MKIRKLIAAAAAAAVAAMSMAVTAFSVNIPMDTENGGAWSLTKTSIPKEELVAIGGDVKVTLHVEIYNPYGLADQFVINPIDVADTWISQTDFITSDTITAKEDGWICINKDATTVEFVIGADTVNALADGGLFFQTANVTVLSADLEPGTPQAVFKRVTDAEGKEYCKADLGGASAPAAETAPASDSATTSSGTGNASSAVILTVIAVSGIAAAASRKRK